MRSSIRELLIVISVLAVVMAALRIGGGLANVVLMVAGGCVVALAIIAIVARDQRQTFAIGFLIPFSLYAAGHYFSSRNELDPYDGGALVTTRMFRPLHEAIRIRTWTDTRTGLELSEFDLDPSIVPQVGADIIYVSNSGIQGSLIEQPKRGMFMMVAHCLLACSVGYIGGKFASYVRRSDRVISPG